MTYSFILVESQRYLAICVSGRFTVRLLIPVNCSALQLLCVAVQGTCTYSCVLAQLTESLFKVYRIVALTKDMALHSRRQCNALQLTVVHHAATQTYDLGLHSRRHCNTLKYAGTRWNTLQHIGTQTCELPKAVRFDVKMRKLLAINLNYRCISPLMWVLVHFIGFARLV